MITIIEITEDTLAKLLTSKKRNNGYNRKIYKYNGKNK